MMPRRVRLRQLHGDREQPQYQEMMIFTDLASVPSHPPAPFTDRLRLAVAADPARFTGTSRNRTESDLRCYLAWCAERGLDPLAARRPRLELYIRWMQEIRRFRPSTVSRRFSVTAGFYRTCVLDGVLDHSPAEHVRRPSVPAESPTLVPLPPAVGRATDRAVASRASGPILLNTRGARMDRHAATRRLRHLAEAADIQIARAHSQLHCWELAERAGHGLPYRMQGLLGRSRWRWEDLRELLPALVQDVLAGGPGGGIGPGLAIDETAGLRKGTATACVAPRHAGVTGKIENCVTWVFSALVTASGEFLLIRRLPDRGKNQHTFYLCHAAEGRPATLTYFITIAGTRRPVETTFRTGKDAFAWDQSQARTWNAICRHTALTALTC